MTGEDESNDAPRARRAPVLAHKNGGLLYLGYGGAAVHVDAAGNSVVYHFGVAHPVAAKPREVLDALDIDHGEELTELLGDGVKAD